MQLMFKDESRWIEKDELSVWVANTNHQCSELANNTLEQEEEEEDWAPRLIIKMQDWRHKIGKLPNFTQVAKELLNGEMGKAFRLVACATSVAECATSLLLYLRHCMVT